MCVTLGFIVFTEGDEDYDPEVKIFVMNHVTNFDHVAMNLILPVVVVRFFSFSFKIFI